jgi:CubicO group peptidase (beta-lactamase class C family)
MAKIRPEGVRALMERARREIDEGLLPGCQVALGFEGELVHFECLGDANEDTRYCIFSATKPFVASVLWNLLAEGKLALSDRIAERIPEFESQGKQAITLEQVMLHTAGFPAAPLGPPAWWTREGRLAAFEKWRLNWEPGSRYEYHPTSAHWVLAELIERVTGQDYRNVVEERVTQPAGLPRILGIAGEGQHTVADLVAVGEHATGDELEPVFGVRELPETEVNEAVLLFFNDPATRELGVPGGGGYGRACDLALFYQAVLHNPGTMWDPATLEDARTHVRNRLPDPMMGVPANRTLGLLQAGDDGKANLRGFGRASSARTIGHNGAGGQLAWVDPETGLSFGYVTNGLDRHEIRQPRRGTALSSLAGACAG